MKNRKLFLLILLTLFTFIAMKSDEIIITKQDEIKINKGKLVTIIGTYKKLYLPIKKKRPGEEDQKKEFSGRVYIKLSDNTKVVIEINEEGIRSEEEIEKFEGKKVQVIGIMNGMSPLWGDGKAASIVMNCIKEVKKIEGIDSDLDKSFLDFRNSLPPIYTITKVEQITENIFKTVKLIGKYKELNVAKAADKIIYNGRVYIELEDGTSIALDSQEKGIRSKGEIKKYKNKKVSVIGMLWPSTQLWGDGTEASIVMNYISGIGEIELFDEKNYVPTITKKEQLDKIKDGTEIKLIGIYKCKTISTEYSSSRKIETISKLGFIKLINDGTIINFYPEISDRTTHIQLKELEEKIVHISGIFRYSSGKDIELFSITTVSSVKEIPLLNSKVKIDELDNQLIQLQGIYKQEEVGKNVYHKNPNDPPHYTGHVCIQLADSSKIFLETGKEGIRSAEEIKKFENKKVFVIGTLYKNHELFEGPENSSVTCVKKITTIELKENE